MELTGDDLAASIVDHCKTLEDTDGARRRNRWFESWSRYEARTFSNEQMSDCVWDETCRYNVTRSAVDTAQAEIASRQRPKPMFLTSGADWQTRRRAKRLDRAVEAQLHQRQGARYADAWELTEDVFRDAANDVGGVVKVYPDHNEGRVRLDRVPAYEILVDAVDAENGDPRVYHHVYSLTWLQAKRNFVEGDDPETIAKLERAANDVSVDMSVSGKRGARFARKVKLYETWILPEDRETPGKHVIATSAGEILVDEEWTWPFPPLAIIVWSHEAFGIWGTGLAQAIAIQHDKVQELARDIDRRFELCARRRIYYVPGTVSEEGLKGNDTVELIPVQGSMANAPQERDTPPVTAAEEQHLDTEIRRCYEFAGVSQMSAQSRKDPGVDAAIAMQTLNDIKSVRFMPKARAYEMLFVRLGQLVARALGELLEEKKSLISTWPGHRIIEEIDVGEAWLEDTMYTVRVAPVSAMSRDPAQRLQVVEQLSQFGMLPKEKYLELIGMPDLDSLLDQETGEKRWIERLVDRYLDSEDDVDLKERGGYAEPDGYLLRPDLALVMVGQHYFDALVNDVPEYNKRLMQRFMGSLTRVIQASEAKKAAAQAPAGPAAGVAPVQMGQAAMPQGMAA